VASARASPSGPKSTGLGGKPTVSEVTGLTQITLADGWLSETATPLPASVRTWMLPSERIEPSVSMMSEKIDAASTGAENSICSTPFRGITHGR
jgi:hypothetical protein